MFNELNYGYLESVYENSLVYELSEAGLNTHQQLPLEVNYKNQNVGEFVADIVVENKVPLELKSVETLHKKHEVQLVSYLNATDTDVGLLINFGPDGVEVNRKLKDLSDRD